MAKLFLSYATADREFALRLAGHLKLLGHLVWLDQWEISVGDSILGRIEEGIDQADCLVVVLSRHTQVSLWVEREVHVKSYEEMVLRRTLVFPVVIEDCAIPPFLRPKRAADFRSGYETGFAQLAVALHTHSGQTPPLSVYAEVDQLRSDTAHVNGSTESGLTMRGFARLTEINFEIGLPYIGKVSGVWKPSREEQQAAWELYVELATRVSATGLSDDAGLLRESLTSLHTIFTLTREILRKHGSTIARPTSGTEISFGYLAIHVLNYVLRPVLTTWHPLLLDYEHAKDPSVSAFEHEQKWAKSDELRSVLRETRDILVTYTNILAQVAGVPHMSIN